jgi:RHS repeat-associated protein
MKNILKHIALLLVFISSKAIAQTPENIIKTDYTVTGTETLLATQGIVLKPTTWIKSGSTFLATVNSDAYIPLNLSNENYIFTRKFQTAMTSTSGISNNSDVVESISYFDGLGRPMQTIAIKASPSKQDIATHIGYDGFGRQEKDYLPYLATTGAVASYRTGADASTNSYYISNYPTDINGSTPNPFSQKKFEDSPLNRTLLQGAPGSAWAVNSGHEIKMEYVANATADNVKLFTALTTWNAPSGVYDIALGNSAGNVFYGVNQLYKTIVKNENWTSGTNNTTEEFKDKEGRVILKKTYGVSIVNQTPVNTAHETYYIYDSFGNLTYVLPPKADGSVTAAVLNDLCYQYKYDNKNRLVEKKLPGKDWEYIVYDKLDRPVLTQDANLRSANKWLFIKYDAFSRPIYTGEYINAAQTSRTAVQTLANGSSTLFETKLVTPLSINGTSINYSNNAFPSTGIDLFTINYYDEYNNIDLDGGSASFSYGIMPIVNPKGLNTCNKVRILGTSYWTTNAIYYDAKGRSVYNYSKNNYLSITTTVKTQFDFAGKVLETTGTHKKGIDALITIVDVYSYDHTGRSLTQKQTINNLLQEVIVSNTYDNLGQLIAKGVGGKTTQSRLQNVAYNYNIRGWLKGINNVNTMENSLFDFQINYNTPTSGTPLFNGNISQTFWKTASIDSSLKNYTYAYDNLNRLTQATDNSASNPGRYNEGLSYDKNGNIMSILRLGNTNPMATTFGTMDNLAYTYDTGNKLTKVEDISGNTEGFSNGSNTANEYTYDLNGNMKTDANKGITAITYNHLNLPTSVSISGGTINYVYDAAGIKQRKTVSTGGSTDYAGGFVYKNNTLKQFSQPEGYVAYNAGIFNYIYQYKDHLGNNRLSYQDKDNNGIVNNTEIVQENNYYAFGLTQKGYNGAINGLDNKYKYNGKELQDDNIAGTQLNFYDFGARNYDPALGRWMNIDPLAETSRRFSPYTYALNNPVYFIDPDGMEATNSYVHDSQNINGRHQMWSDRHPGSFANESNDSMFTNPELPMDRLKTLNELQSEERSTATAGDLEELETLDDDEPPVNLFTFFPNDVFNNVVNTRKYKDGDGIFSVWTHGAPGLMADYINHNNITTIEQFETMMGKMSPNWANAKDKAGTVLFLFSCNSGATNDYNGINLAQIISKAHPEMRVVGAEGFYRYVQLKNGKYKIAGIEAIQHSADDLGYMVSYKNGIRVSRELYTDVLKRVRKK